jgi:lipid-binding SYLF domain-containing protein
MDPMLEEEYRMKKTFVFVMMMVLLCTLMASVASAATVEEKKESVRKAVGETLQELYTLQPAAKAAVEGNAGYAVFNNIGTKILISGSGKGKGMAVNNKDKTEIFMKMREVQVGLGFGIKEFSVVFVFETEEALNNFVNQGWEFGGQATLAATDNVSGGSMSGAASVSPGVWMYQFTKKGLAAEVTVKGTKYYKDSDLK